MAISTETEAGFEWPEDVLTYAIEHGFDQYLQPTLEMTRRVFPDASKIEVVLEPDGDIPELWFVVFDVTVSGMTVPEMVAARQRWIRESLPICPVRPDCNIVLGLEEAP